MKKYALILILFVCAFQLFSFSFVPGYHGARSLGLGTAGLAFNYDINAIFINPSLLPDLSFSMTGYQYQNSYSDYKSFMDDFNALLESPLTQYESLGTAEKSELFSRLKDVFQSKAGAFGFSSSVPGFVGRGYGLSVSLVNTAFMHPINPSGLDSTTDFFSRAPSTVTNNDIASLQMNMVGLKYKQVSLSYGMPISRNLTVGVTLHYLNGKVTEFDTGITAPFFVPGQSTRDYLEQTWGAAEEKFSKIITDLAVSMSLGQNFKVSLVTRNVGDPTIKTPAREITMKRRIIAGLAFRPSPQWGIYMDVDIAKSDLYHNGNEIQPIALGIEKGFFQNSMFVRLGLLNDLTDKHFLGSKSNALIGVGLGFNMKRFMVDVGMALNGSGSIKSLAVSGLIVFK